ncbi:MAG: hypothetical protein OET87_05270 [Desulfobulbaceae bacterium]|jgi:basic membrane lipoprotein Med (substrate-binding protein (PBP1-ABC) superfamily)|nr:hypothetical protein [Gammaproteobacteria bacterium]MDH3996344.1 hypothetical protein [Desulfobulbaceae bacterium]
MFLESWQMKKWIVAIFYLFIVVGCAQPETVSKVEIMTLSEKWKEPKVAIWYYKGSDEKYHYFKYFDLGIKREYRVVKNEISLESTFSVTPNEEEWRAMPWGPYANR